MQAFIGTAADHAAHDMPYQLKLIVVLFVLLFFWFVATRPRDVD